MEVPWFDVRMEILYAELNLSSVPCKSGRFLKVVGNAKLSSDTIEVQSFVDIIQSASLLHVSHG